MLVTRGLTPTPIAVAVVAAYETSRVSESRHPWRGRSRGLGLGARDGQHYVGFRRQRRW